MDDSTHSVTYANTDGTDNVLRRLSIIAPGGKQVDSSYSTSGDLDNVFNRVSSLKVNGEGANLVDYAYAGLRRYVTLTYPTPDAELSYLQPSGVPGTGDAGDAMTGYDRFGRTVRMPWRNGTSGDALADITYGYDRASRRLWRGDLTPDSDAAFDRYYGYDALGQVKAADRGTLNENRTAIGGIPQEAEAWRYDEQGNWLTYDKAEDGAAVIDQTRRYNQSNQIVAIDGTNDGVSYDKNGNMTRIPTGDALTGAPRKLVWNAWDQLVQVRDEADALIQTNAYDGLFRRTARTLADSTVIHQYYNDQWKPIEERKDAATDPLAVYYWGARPGHRDELIRRDRDTDGNGTLDETLWCLMDYFDPMAILNSSGAVQERYIYSAFGVPLILAPDYATRGSSSFAWDFLFHGQFTDAETGYQNYGYRFYVPALGAWPSRDPIGEEGGHNMYCIGRNDSISNLDHLGKSPIIIAALIAAGIAAWEIYCGTKAIEEAGTHYNLAEQDKQYHCYVNCASNRCTLLLLPNLKFIEGVALEIYSHFSIYKCFDIFSEECRKFYADSVNDIRANVYGIIMSYSFSSCREVCDKCPIPNGYNPIF